MFDMLYKSGESIGFEAEPDVTLPSFTIHELPYQSICMTTMIAVITHGLRWAVVTFFIQMT